MPDTDWEAAGYLGAVVRWDNPIFAGPTSHDRPVALSFGSNNKSGAFGDDVIGITGTSYAGPATRYDIVTLLLNAETGNPFGAWGGSATRSFNGSANSNDSAVGLDLHWIFNAGLFVVVAGTTKSLNSGQINDDMWTIEYEPGGTVRWEQVYNGPANGDDVATAMTLDGDGVFVCGYTLHYDPGQSASSGGGSGTGAQPGGGAAAGPQPPDTDYIALAYDDGIGSPWADWPDVGSPNVTGVRVFNGPGPTANKSDDRAMDVGVTNFGEEIWLTGTVREADGLGYDTATIRYNALNPLADPAQVVRVDLPTTTEKAIALAADALAFPGEIYVTGTIQRGNSDLPMIQTFKIVSGAPMNPVWTRLFGYSISDIPSAIIAPTRNDNSVSVFVFGRSFLLPTSYDQVGVHYTQDP